MAPTTRDEQWVEQLLWMALAAGVSGFLLGACAQNKVRPDEMSAAAHREEAQREYAQADRELRQYDPNKEAREPIHSARIEVGETSYTTYNPTQYHLTDAERHAAHAREHLAAAAELERFVDQACQPFSGSMRAACPVLGPVSSIEDIRGGVRVYLQPDAPVDAVLAHMQCHLAYAREHGWLPVPDCPLYLRGVEIRRAAGGRAIELLGSDGKTVDELRRRAHDELHGPTI